MNKTMTNVEADIPPVQIQVPSDKEQMPQDRHQTSDCSSQDARRSIK